MSENELRLDALREKDRLVSEENEVFVVAKALGRNVLCCKQEIAFRIKSIDHRGKELIILGRLTSDGELILPKFKKHQPHAGLN